MSKLEVDRAKFGPQTVVGRLREYARVRHEDQPNVWPSENTLYRVMRDRENAGARAKGIRYDMISTEEDPEAMACRPDGGLGDLIERRGHEISRFARCQEIATSLGTYFPRLRQ